MRPDSLRKSKNASDKLASAIICLAGFAVVISEISNGSDRISLNRLGVWYGAILLTAAVICICCSIRIRRCRIASWIKENWYVFLYLILRIISGVVNGAIGKEVFLVSVCSEAFLLLAVNSATARSINIRIVLCIIVAFDLITMSLCVYHSSFMLSQTWNALKTYGQGASHSLPFSFIFFYPNSAGMLAGLTAVILFIILTKEYRGTVKALIFLLMLINVGFVLWSDSRTGMLGIALVCVIFILKKTIRGASFRKLLSITVICCVAMLIPVYAMTLISASQRGMTNTEFELQINDISSGRYSIWKHHIASQKGHYLLGFGTNKNAINARLDNISEAEEKGLSIEEENLSAAQNASFGAHNGYLDLILVSGIPGFLLILFYIYKRISGMDNRSIEAHPEIMILIYLFVICTQESRFITSGLNYITLLMMLLLNYSPFFNCSPAETSREDYPLYGGAQESVVYVTDSDGHNVRTHIMKVGKESGLQVKAVCGACNGDPQHPGFRSLSQQVKEYKGSEEVIAASSGGFYDIRTGTPLGILITGGQRISTSDNKPFFAVLNDGRYVIRRSGERTDDVAEALSGNRTLIRKGKVKVKNSNVRHPRQAIGICRDGSLVIVNAEGRQPGSGGLRLRDLAELMKAQGCIDAINLDGGGSAGLITKRIGDEEPVFRTIPGDGFERNISSAMLFVKKSKKIPSGPTSQASSMFSSKTQLDRTIFGRYIYRINGEKPSGLYNINGKAYLFNKGKGVSRKLTIGETSYTFRKGKYRSSSDPEAGNVLFGYCGIREYDGKNLVYAFHDGDGLLNIGTETSRSKRGAAGKQQDNYGEMKNWTRSNQEKTQPWYACRHRIRRVYIADGVTSIGNRFLYMPKGVVKGSTKTPLNELEELRLPESLERIGRYAFYNKPLLKAVKIPNKAAETGKNAFDEHVILSE